MQNKFDNQIAISTLVIEDNEGDFVLVEDYLLEKFNPITIKNCRDYIESVSYIESNQDTLSIILLDIHLPDLSGVELINETLKSAGKVPVIILTGYADLEIAKLSLQLGVSDYLVKDELNPTLLHKSIEFAINRRQFISQIENERLKFKNLFDLSPQPMWLLSLDDFNIINANNSATEKYGFTLEEFRKLSFLQLHKLEESILVRDYINQNITQRNNQFTHYTKRNEAILVEIFFEKVNINETEKGIVIQINDVTQTLFHIQTIEEQNETLKNIAWTQSHVVRATLSRILGIVNLIDDQKDDLDDLAYWLSQLKVSSNELDAIIRNIVEETKNIGNITTDE